MRQFRTQPILLAVTTPIQELIAAVDRADSAAALIGAVRALAATRSPDSISTLIQVLGFNNPGAAVAAMDGLVHLGGIAVQPLIDQLDGYNYGARAYSIRALAAIRDPRALETLLVAAETDFAPSVRRAATKGVGCLNWQQLPQEQIADAQAKVLSTLLLVSRDADWAIRYAAIVGLQALAQSVLSQPAEMLAAIGDRVMEIAETEPASATGARARLAHDRLQAIHRQHQVVGC